MIAASLVLIAWLCTGGVLCSLIFGSCPDPPLAMDKRLVALFARGKHELCTSFGEALIPLQSLAHKNKRRLRVVGAAQSPIDLDNP